MMVVETGISMGEGLLCTLVVVVSGGPVGVGGGGRHFLTVAMLGTL